MVLLRKGDKPVENPSSYRPICLLNTVGKLFESIIRMLLDKHLEEVGGLNDRQYGFRKRQFTVDLIKKLMETADKSSTDLLRKRHPWWHWTFEMLTARWHRIVRDYTRRRY